MQEDWQDSLTYQENILHAHRTAPEVRRCPCRAHAGERGLGWGRGGVQVPGGAQG